jgi:hypothetical protein
MLFLNYSQKIAQIFLVMLLDMNTTLNLIG